MANTTYKKNNNYTIVTEILQTLNDSRFTNFQKKITELNRLSVHIKTSRVSVYGS